MTSLLCKTLCTWHWQRTAWICRKVCVDSVISNDMCPPVPLFIYIILKNPSWGRYAEYIVQRHFPTQGERVWRYLKRKYPQWSYSFLLLLGQWLRYHVRQISGRLYWSFQTLDLWVVWNRLQKPMDCPRRKLDNLFNSNWVIRYTNFDETILLPYLPWCLG